MDVVRGNDKEVCGFCGGEPWARNIVVSLDINGASAGVRLSGGPLEMSDEQLASQIVRLNTLAYLRWQLSLRSHDARKYRHGWSMPTA